VKNNWLLGNIPMNKFNKQHMINFHLTHKNESKNEDSSFERLKQDKNQLMPPSSESSAIWLTDRAVESEEFCDTGPIEYITKPQNTHKSSNNIFDRLYKESDIKMQRRAQLAQTHNKIPTKAKSKSKRCKSNKRGQFSRMKIEDKLMQRHITAKLKIDKQRKEVAMQELQYWNLRPPLSSATLEMVNNNRNLLQRQNDLRRRLNMKYVGKKKMINRWKDLQENLRSTKDLEGCKRVISLNLSGRLTSSIHLCRHNGLSQLQSLMLILFDLQNHQEVRVGLHQVFLQLQFLFLK